MDVRQLGVTMVLSLLLVPSGLAAWAVRGNHEPDTVDDTTSGWMTLDPDRVPNGAYVYFNGFASTGGLVTTTLSPNLATLRTSIATLPLLPAALFGVWKDCNGDGFVGHGDQGLLEYPTSLLPNVTTCPALSGQFRHNDGKWVIEYVPIGYDDVTTARDEDPLNLNDTNARVWADWGRPGDAPMLTCATFPAPHGAFRSTGGLLRWLDCFTAFRATSALNTIAHAVGEDELAFDDAPPDRPDRSTSPLNQPNPWGSESDESSAQVFDCSEPTVFQLEDPTGGGLRNIATLHVGDSTIYVNGTDSEGNILNITFFSPAPGTRDGGSPAGTVNETEAELTDCDRSNPGGEMIGLNGRNGGSDADLPYLLEGPNEPISALPRTQTDHVFTFEEGARNGNLASILGARSRDDAGISPASVMGFWVGTGSNAAGPNAYLDTREAGPAPASYLTYYAYLSPSLVTQYSLRLPAGSGFGVYGASGCSAGTFACDPTAWWRDSAGHDIVPRDPRLGADPNDPTIPDPYANTAIGVRIWQRFQMRDVDCFDASANTLRESGAHWGRLTGTACARP